MMKWRVLSLVAGVLMILQGLSAGYWWFYTIAPARRTLDPNWIAEHSQLELWREIQSGIHRGVWTHDDGFIVGWFGDKSSAEWIMNNVTPGMTMDCFSRLSHAATAMRFITNQHVGEDAQSWLSWWEKNKSKPQERWIAEGFSSMGFAIDVPSKPNQIKHILALLGKLANDEANDPFEHIKYNAFRCLRDSGFDPVRFVLVERNMSNDVEKGLLRYSDWLRRWPQASGVGVLSIAKKKPVSHHLPEILIPQFQIKQYALIFIPAVFGSVLIIWPFVARRRSTPG